MSKTEQVNSNILSTKQTAGRKKKNIKGTAGAVIAGAVVQTLASAPSFPAINKMVKISGSLSKDEVSIVNKAGEDIVSKVTNLGKKGVKIIDVTSSKNITNLPDGILELINPLFATARGKNAFFTDKDILNIPQNSVALNLKKLPVAVFHELGHAFNYNNSAFWKTMQRLRTPGMIVASVIAMFPAFTKETKPEEGKELTKGQKIKNGLRKASPALAFGAMLPMLLEEAKASFRGCKWAKDLLSPKLYKKVFKTNAVAYVSYLATALSFSAFALAAKKVKDNSQNKLEKKLAAQSATA